MDSSFSAILATIAGIYDGKLRFKRIKTPHLKKKLVLAGFFIFISAALFVLYEFLTLNQSAYNTIILIFSLITSIVAVLLGFIGGKLLDSKVRG